MSILVVDEGSLSNQDACTSSDGNISPIIKDFIDGLAEHMRNITHNQGKIAIDYLDYEQRELDYYEESYDKLIQDGDYSNAEKIAGRALSLVIKRSLNGLIKEEENYWLKLKNKAKVLIDSRGALAA